MRRHESRTLSYQDHNPLKGNRFLFLKNPENHTIAQAEKFKELKDLNLRTSKAWQMKENLKGFFTCQTIDEAEKFLKLWIEDVNQNGSFHMKRVAAMFENHKMGLLNYIKHRITNAVAEGINSRIQEIKFVARGFRTFENYRIAILFFLGKLDLKPQKSR